MVLPANVHATIQHKTVRRTWNLGTILKSNIHTSICPMISSLEAPLIRQQPANLSFKNAERWNQSTATRKSKGLSIVILICTCQKACAPPKTTMVIEWKVEITANLPRMMLDLGYALCNHIKEMGSWLVPAGLNRIVYGWFLRVTHISWNFPTTWDAEDFIF